MNVKEEPLINEINTALSVYIGERVTPYVMKNIKHTLDTTIAASFFDSYANFSNYITITIGPRDNNLILTPNADAPQWVMDMFELMGTDT